MHVHILGICGTFMAGIAKLAIEKGYKVTGQDEHVYPPMSDLLANMAVKVTEGYDVDGLPEAADLIIVGNAMKRGMPIIEHVLDNRLNFVSGPEWLHHHILKDKRVIAISGTHGKTTTSAMLAWTLELAGLNPSFLVGGLLPNFNSSARLTDSQWFVVEADEYDTAFFDKRSKFVHYYPEILSINNLEFDHADIFKSIDDIIFQFHCLLRVLPQKGLLITPEAVNVIEQLVLKGLWTERQLFNCDNQWHINALKSDYSHFVMRHDGTNHAEINWHLIGRHNAENALVTQIIAKRIGLSNQQIKRALESFKPVKRRLELIAKNDGVHLYEDFAHHPTAINSTISGLRQQVGNEDITVILDFASHTMRSGYHKDRLTQALAMADDVILFNAPTEIRAVNQSMSCVDDVDSVITKLTEHKKLGHVVVMSNRGTAELTGSIVDKFNLKSE